MKAEYVSAVGASNAWMFKIVSWEKHDICPAYTFPFVASRHFGKQLEMSN